MTRKRLGKLDDDKFSVSHRLELDARLPDHRDTVARLDGKAVNEYAPGGGHQVQVVSAGDFVPESATGLEPDNE